MLSNRNAVLITLLCLALLSACATRQQAHLPVIAEPQLNGDHALMADGYRLPLQAWAPPVPARAVVLALHGFNDYRNAFSGVGPYLAERGILTYAIDQRGFGETAQRGLWPGSDRLSADVHALSELLRRRHPGLPVYLLGESMGAAVAIAALTDGAQPAPVDGVVLMAPAVWGRDAMPWYQRWALSLAVQLFPGWTPTGESLERWPSDNIEMLRALARDPLVIKATRIDTIYGLVKLMDHALAQAPELSLPSLLLYGEHDQIIPKEPVCRVVEQLPEAADRWRLALYPEGWHMLGRDLQAERVLADIASWMLDRGAPLPSGLEAAPAAWRQRLCR